MKIGLWLQDYSKCTEKNFYKVLETVKKSDIDLLVFPEAAYTPFSDLVNMKDVMKQEILPYYDKCYETAEYIQKPIVFSDMDVYGTLFSYYVNPFAKKDETNNHLYVKHTATNSSAFDFTNYEEVASEELFEPIILHGKKIGLTICYDCNHSVFSRIYGKQNVDIIINSTGGNIVHEKWFKYNQVRAIENQCFTFVTMGYDKDKKVNSYVFGFGPNGNPLPYTNLMYKNPETTNLVGSVYVYDTEDDTREPYVDTSNLIATENKYQDIYIESGNVTALLNKAKKIEDNLYLLKHKKMNLVFCVCDDEEIMLPENGLRKIYSKSLIQYENKRYILVNRWNKLDEHYYKTKVLPVLKVRAMENYCAVIMESKIGNACFQCGQNRTSQVVKCVDNKFGIDAKRISGPETIWKNKPGMKACWRKGVEYLVFNKL